MTARAERNKLFIELEEILAEFPEFFTGGCPAVVSDRITEIGRLLWGEDEGHARPELAEATGN